MANVHKLAKLFKAISDTDLGRAASLAQELIQEEERRGHRGAAATLRGSLNPNGKSGSHIVHSELAPAPGALLTSALSPISGTVRLADVKLRPSTRKELGAIINEWNHRKALDRLGVSRRNKLFFHGPPGCGKSLTALAVGNELSLPTFVVRFDAVIGAYLGQTAIHLRELFRFAESTPSLVLFDEIDALGKKRGNPLDVGELDRIVISLMQELEHSDPKGIVIATSNLPQHLDHALWRRFDLCLELPRPSQRELLSFATELCEQRQIPLPPALRREVAKAANYMAAEKIVESRVRAVALSTLSNGG
jgi:SpoVK/Ycf46/Vps4 family AAA+-type ATPase